MPKTVLHCHLITHSESEPVCSSTQPPYSIHLDPTMSLRFTHEKIQEKIPARIVDLLAPWHTPPAFLYTAYDLR